MAPARILVLLLLASGLALAACGDGGDAAPGAATSAAAPSVTTTPADPPATATTPAAADGSSSAGPLAEPGDGDADVLVTLRPEGDGGPTVAYRLRCGLDGPWLEPAGPAGAQVPAIDPAAACAALIDGAEVLAPDSPDVACTLQLGGPARATIVGTVAGSEVDASLSRGGGCEIARWDRLVAVIGPPGPIATLPPPDPA